MKYITASLLALFVVGLMIPSAFAENVPEWVKNTAGWWATDVISETEFVNAIEFLVKENIIQVNASQASETSQGVPDWVKNTAGWWAEDAISETEFVNTIEFLIKKGIIKIDDTCIYEINRVFANTDQKIIQQLCNNEYNLDYTKEMAIKKPEDVQVNEFGFRGPEIIMEKPANTYRIFTIGGSSMYSDDSLNDETISYHLQKKFNLYDLGVKIEVINAGINGAWSYTETAMIKDKLVEFTPDLLLVYDGWNDHSRKEMGYNSDEYEWRDNWVESCKFGKQNNFETIVTLQPLLGSGKKFQTDQELKIFVSAGWQKARGYQLYANQLEEIGKHCTDAVDLRNAFDYVPYPVYFDMGHKNTKGNEAIAEEFFNLSSPLILEKYNISSDLIKPIPAEPIQKQTQTHSAVLDYSWRVISNQDFTGKDLRDANFEGSIIKDADFSYANLEGANFRFSDIDKTNFKNVNLESADISRSFGTNLDFSNANLNNAKMFGSKFDNGIMKDTIMTNMDLRVFFGNVFFDETILTNSDLSFVLLDECDLTNSDLSNVILYYTQFWACDLSGIDLSITDFSSDNKFVGSSLRNAILPDELFNTDLTAKSAYIGSEWVAFTGADLSGVDLRGKDFSNVQFTHLKLDTLEGVDLGYQSDIAANLSETNFSGENLSGLKLQFIKFNNANLSRTNLSNSDLRFSDLSGANLEDANLQGANLQGAYIDESTNLKCLNHPICLNE
jgi:uncharacterized protein YjbI with pentapeptide repeats